MPNSPVIQWKRIFVEATAIVASILLAFAIDAWWHDRVEKVAETQYLVAIHEDFVRSLELLDETEAMQREQVQFLNALLLADSDTSYSDELRDWIYDGLFSIRTYLPQLSALDELESSGQSEIIRNPQIRRSLAIVRQRLDTVDTGIRDLQATQQGIIDPFLVNNFNLADLMPELPGNSRTDLSALGSSELNSRIAFKLAIRDNISRSQSEMREAVNAALKLVESELRDRGRL